ncbi:hypothetical protein XELAEV_18038620mg [Xenopus laevis]|uniref:Uncharacterized protein n=1 Tax=Xenopus laevis TaxID=8355 RepID=A0A974H7H0_XENLA|nr:hypothetical protein XELAEV_18038620mg [Xenopus laevis]
MPGSLFENGKKNKLFPVPAHRVKALYKQCHIVFVYLKCQHNTTKPYKRDWAKTQEGIKKSLGSRFLIH